MITALFFILFSCMPLSAKQLEAISPAEIKALPRAERQLLRKQMHAHSAWALPEHVQLGKKTGEELSDEEKVKEEEVKKKLAKEAANKPLPSAKSSSEQGASFCEECGVEECPGDHDDDDIDFNPEEFAAFLQQAFQLPLF
jgi:hypothetical protein